LLNLQDEGPVIVCDIYGTVLEDTNLSARKLLTPANLLSSVSSNLNVIEHSNSEDIIEPFQNRRPSLSTTLTRGSSRLITASLNNEEDELTEEEELMKCIGQQLKGIEGQISPASLHMLAHTLDEVQNMKKTSGKQAVMLGDGRELSAFTVWHGGEKNTVQIDLTGKVLLVLGTNGQIRHANANAASLLTNATYQVKGEAEHLKGIDVLDAVLGHGLEEYLLPETLGSWQRALGEVLQLPDGKAVKLDLEIGLGQQRDVRLEVEIERRFIGGRRSQRNWVYKVVGKPVPRSLWEDVVLGPLWVEPADLTKRCTMNHVAKQMFAHHITLLPDFELWRAVAGMMDDVVEKDVQTRVSEKVTRQTTILTNAMLKAAKRSPEVLLKARELERAIETVRNGGECTEAKSFPISLPTGETAEVIADISPIYKDPQHLDSGFLGVLIDGVGETMIMAFDPHNFVIDCNKYAEDTLQAIDEEEEIAQLAGLALEVFSSGYHLEALHAAFKQARMGRQVHISRVRIQDPTGISYIVRATIHPWLDEYGYICGTMIEMQDIGEHLFEFDVYEYLLKSDTLSAAWLLNTDGQVTARNEQADMVIDPANIDSDLRFPDYLPVEEQDRMAIAIAQATEGLLSEVIMATPATATLDNDGYVDVGPRYNDYGHIVGVMVMQQDPKAVSINEAGLILECNKAAAKMLGLGQQELLGEDFMHLIGVECQTECFERLLEVLEHGGTQQMNCDVLTKREFDGQFALALCNLTMSPRRPLAGDENGVMIVMQVIETSLDTFRIQVVPCSFSNNSHQAVIQRSSLDRTSSRTPASPDRMSIGRVSTDNAFFGQTDSDEYTGHVDIFADGVSFGREEPPADQEGPQDPVRAMFQAILETEDDCFFELNHLRYWLLRTIPECRPHCLVRYNPWRTKKLQELFERMDQDEDGVVSEEEFAKWWEDNVPENETKFIGESASTMLRTISQKIERGDSNRRPSADLIRQRSATVTELIRRPSAAQLGRNMFSHARPSALGTPELIRRPSRVAALSETGQGSNGTAPDVNVTVVPMQDL